MSNQNLSLSMRLLLDSRQFVQGLTGSLGSVNKFTKGVQGEIARVRSSFNTMQGKLATVGISVGIGAIIRQSAQLDKNLTQIGITAGTGSGEVEQLRNRLFALSRDTGQPVNDLMEGFNNLVQSGLNFKEAQLVIEAVSKAMVITGANANSLTSGLSVAAAAFNFDLSKPQLATQLLERMTVAGRLGNAELENLSDIFARVGVNAQGAGLSFDKTLAFIESLSIVERQPERLATLADSTLRLFTNNKYRSAAQSATGVRFFDKEGAARDPVAVLNDLRAKFQKLTTDAQRANFVGRAFGNADLDTQKGLRTLLSGNSLGRIDDFNKTITNAGGDFDRNMDRAINNAIDQTGRLKGVLREAADDFSKSINAGVSSSIKKLLDENKDGGLGLSGKEIIGYGAGALTAGYLAKRFLPGALGKIIGGGTNLATGVGVGKALEAAGAATPVYVVNMPDGGLGGPSIPSIAGRASGLSLLERLRMLAFNPATALIGLTAGSAYASYKYAPALQAKMDAATGGQDYADYLGGAPRTKKAEPFEGTLRIELMSNETRAMVRTARSNSTLLNIDIDQVGMRGAFP